MGGDIKEYEYGTYEGDLENGERHGKGKMTYSNGEVYEGEWVNDVKSGKGKRTFSIGDVYEGEWQNSEMNGQGKLTYSNGTVYEGEWKNGLKNGQGKMSYSNGTEYEGEWKNNVKSGKGKRTFSNGDVYEGEWKNDIMNGQGRLTYTNGAVYEGEWKNDIMNGKGKLAYNGSEYEGEWKNGKRHGQGKMTYSNGTVYEGEWKNDDLNGQGKMTYSNGDVYDGEWKDGKPYITELNISNTNYAECLGKTAFEPIEGDVNIGAFINDDKGNLVFKLGESFYGINKEQIRPIYKNSGETVYCCKNVDTSIVPRRENVDIDNPYFNLNKIGVISGIVKRNYITKILGDTTNKLYEIVKTEQKCVAITTGQMLGPNPNAVSADHCQAKSDKVIYEIQIIKEETRGGEKYKKSSRKNKTKKNKTKKRKLSSR